MNNAARITRTTIEATDEVVAEAVSRDFAGRSSDLVAFVQLLDRIDGNYSIFLDAPWGNGKTFFIKEAALVLREGNACIRTGEDANASAVLANKAELGNLHLPVYFNAWECDYCDRPVASLIETLVDGFSGLKGG